MIPELVNITLDESRRAPELPSKRSHFPFGHQHQRGRSGTPPVRRAQTNARPSGYRYGPTTREFDSEPPSEIVNPRPSAVLWSTATGGVVRVQDGLRRGAPVGDLVAVCPRPGPDRGQLLRAALAAGPCTGAKGVVAGSSVVARPPAFAWRSSACAASSSALALATRASAALWAASVARRSVSWVRSLRTRAAVADGGGGVVLRPGEQGFHLVGVRRAGGCRDVRLRGAGAVLRVRRGGGKFGVLESVGEFALGQSEGFGDLLGAVAVVQHGGGGGTSRSPTAGTTIPAPTC